MASVCRRYKWQLRSAMVRYKNELLLFIVLVFVGIVFIHVLMSLEENDGTYIDLSPQRQQELIDEYVREREQRRLVGGDTGAIDNEADAILEMKAARLLEKQRVDVKLDSKANLDTNLRNTASKIKGGNIGAPKGPVGNLTGGRAQCTLYDVTKDIETPFECVQLKIVKPNVTVCLHPESEDVHVSKTIRKEGIWEPHIIKQFQDILNSDPELGVIDIGAHIGLYSLVAANMQHPVVAVEPLQPNLVRLHKAIKISHVENLVSVVQNVVSDNRMIVSLKTFNDNQGGTAVDKEEPCYVEGCHPNAKSIHMDDLLEVINFKKAVIKIDIEGHEHRAFAHSKQLLKDISVPYIFMEWMKLRSYYGTEIDESEDKDLTHWLVNYLTEQGYTPYSTVTGSKLNIGYWYGWTDDIFWKHDLA